MMGLIMEEREPLSRKEKIQVSGYIIGIGLCWVGIIALYINYTN